MYEEIRDSFLRSLMTPTRSLRAYIRPILVAGLPSASLARATAVLGSLALAAISSSGCAPGADAPSPVDPVIRDSADVVIVENPAGQRDRVPEWRAESQPILSIGQAEGADAEQLTYVSGARRLPDGTIAILDMGSRELRLFEPDGSHRRTVGGPGEGPGEFGLVSLPFVEMHGDTLGVWDLGSFRLTLLTSDGILVETRTLAVPIIAPIGFAAPGVVVAQGSSSASVRPGDPEGVQTNRSAFVRIALDHDNPASPSEPPVDTLGVIGRQQLLQWSSGQQMGFTLVPFTVGPSAGVGPDRVVITEGTRPELRIHDGGGRLVRIVRLLDDPEPLDAARFEAEVERRVAASPEHLQDEIRRRHAAMPRPGFVPAWSGTLLMAVGRLFLDPEARIWIERFRPDWNEPLRGGPSHWDVFDREGALVATARLPDAFVPHQFTEEGVLGVRRGELDVPYVELYQIERASAPEGPR